MSLTDVDRIRCIKRMKIHNEKLKKQINREKNQKLIIEYQKIVLMNNKQIKKLEGNVEW